jgi:hypothetical protein
MAGCACAVGGVRHRSDSRVGACRRPCRLRPARAGCSGRGSVVRLAHGPGRRARERATTAFRQHGQLGGLAGREGRRPCDNLHHHPAGDLRGHRRATLARPQPARVVGRQRLRHLQISRPRAVEPLGALAQLGRRSGAHGVGSGVTSTTTYGASPSCVNAVAARQSRCSSRNASRSGSVTPDGSATKRIGRPHLTHVRTASTTSRRERRPSPPVVRRLTATHDRATRKSLWACCGFPTSTVR